MIFAFLAALGGSPFLTAALWQGALALDQHRVAVSFVQFETCRVCMGKSWGQPDEPQPTVAEFEACCPEYPGPVWMDCARQLGQACDVFELPGGACWSLVANVCLAVVPPVAWAPFYAKIERAPR